MPPRPRALSDAEKLARRQEIQATALALYAEQSYEAITMNQVAKACGLAKGTLYLYFPTKEALFLTLLGDALAAWFDAIDTALAADATAMPPETLVELLADSLRERPQLLRLIAILHTVLERNIDLPTALCFKRALARRAAGTAALLERRLPFLVEGEGIRLLVRTHALIIGLQQQAEPAPIVREALAEPDLAPLRVDFHAEFLTTLRILLQGLVQQRSQPNA